MIGIYLIENKKNKKIYVGQSSCLPQRFNEHKYKLRKNKHGNSHLQAAWNKYGEESFEFSILLLCPLERLNINEQTAKDYFEKTVGVYNQGIIVENPNRGRICSKETRLKLSLLSKGKKLKLETIIKYRNTSKNKPVERIDLTTGEIKKYISQQAAGRDGFISGHVSACCRGERELHMGYYWRFLDENNEE